jgi:hypothetical protein
MFQAHSKKARNLSLSKRATRKAITAETLDLSRLLAIHREMFKKLVLPDRELSMTVAELFEDIGNRYLDISDEISASINHKPTTQD